MNLNFTLILQIISFLILLGLLTKFLYKPLSRYLDERAQDIKDMLENTQRSEEQAKTYAEKTEKTLGLAKEEALKIKDEARRLSDSERRRIVDEARGEALSLVEEARRQLGRERESVMKEIRADIADISVDIARRILGREISKQDHNRLIEESIAEIKDALPRS